MPTHPLVTVVVPAYNASATIAATLASVQAQTYTQLDIVVIDDGSTDDTARRVARMAHTDPRIRLAQQSNRGVAAARNHGVRVARGSLIAPLDADDLWHPTKVAQQVERLQAAGPGTGAVYTWWVALDAADRVLGVSHPWALRGSIFEALVHINFIGNASVPLFRRDIVEAVGGYRRSLMEQGGQGCEDWDLTLRVAERSAFTVAPAYLVGYRGSPDSMSCDTDGMAASFRVMVYDLVQRQPNLSPSLLRSSAGHFFEYLAGQAFSGGHPRRALQHLSDCLQHDPVRWANPHVWRMGLLSIVDACLGRHVPRPPRSTSAISWQSVAQHAAPDAFTAIVFGASGQEPWSWRPFDWIERRRWHKTCTRCALRAADLPSAPRPPALSSPNDLLHATL